MDAYQNLVEKLHELPSQPAVLRRLQSLISQEEVSSHQAAEIIEMDQGFTVRILRLVNSPFYGFSRMVVSVEEAITMLGFNAVHQLLLTSSLMKSMDWQGKAVNLHAFWKHSFGVGVAAKHLLYGMDKHIMDEAFICGIVHDVGRLVYIKTDFKKYAAFHAGPKRATSLNEEREFFGADHQVLGQLLAGKWNFPESVRTVI
ncbi:MAG: HDOD domain-containing protein, partial [candidate division Zixibacteria bacterium]|nr:HDOD domain-containing protein [candidate division Zixibacteria bacterium]